MSSISRLSRVAVIGEQDKVPIASQDLGADASVSVGDLVEFIIPRVPGVVDALVTGDIGATVAGLDSNLQVPTAQIPTVSRAKLGSDVTVTLDAVPGKVDATTKGQANGVATLGSDGKVPAGQLPAVVGLPTLETFPANGQIDLSGYKEYAEKAVMADLTITPATGAVLGGSANFRLRYVAGTVTFAGSFQKYYPSGDDVSEPGTLYECFAFVRDGTYYYNANNVGSFDTAPPTFVSAITSTGAPGSVVFTFDENVSASPVVAGDITLTNAGGRTITGVSKSGTTVTGTYSTPLVAGVMPSFSIAAGKIQDGSGNVNASPIAGTITNNIASAITPVGDGANTDAVFSDLTDLDKSGTTYTGKSTNVGFGGSSIGGAATGDCAISTTHNTGADWFMALYTTAQSGPVANSPTLPPITVKGYGTTLQVEGGPSFTLAAGDQVVLQRLGTVASLLRKPSGGVWASVYTYSGASSGSLYPVAAVYQQGKIVAPKVFGFAAASAGTLSIGNPVTLVNEQQINIGSEAPVAWTYWTSATTTRRSNGAGDRINQSLKFFDAANPNGGAASTALIAYQFSAAASEDGPRTNDYSGARVDSDNGPMGAGPDVLIGNKQCVVRVWTGVINGGQNIEVRVESSDAGVPAVTKTFSTERASIDFTMRGASPTSRAYITARNNTAGSSGYQDPLIAAVGIVSEVA